MSEPGFQTLLQSTLIASNNVADAAIVRKKDGAIKALTSGFKVC